MAYLFTSFCNDVGLCVIRKRKPIRQSPAGMWPLSRHLGLEAVSRHINASILSRTDWQMPQSGNQGSRSCYCSRIVIFFAHMAIIFIYIQNALMWPQPSVLFAQLNSLPCHRPLHIGLQYSFSAYTVFKNINLQANIVIILFVYYQLISTTFINVRRKNKAKQCRLITKKHCRV